MASKITWNSERDEWERQGYMFIVNVHDSRYLTKGELQLQNKKKGTEL